MSGLLRRIGRVKLEDEDTGEKVKWLISRDP